MAKTSKKILSVFLSLLMIISMCSVMGLSVFAEDEPMLEDTISDEMSAKHIDHETPFTFTEGEVPAGSYYLVDDIALTGDLTITGEVHLCLNGKVLNINGDHAIKVNGEDATLNIYDCQDTVHKFSDSEDGMSWVLDEENGDKEVAGGVITGAINSTTAHLNGFLQIIKGSLNLFKGNFIGNRNVQETKSWLKLIAFRPGTKEYLYSSKIYGNYICSTSSFALIDVNMADTFWGKYVDISYNNIGGVGTDETSFYGKLCSLTGNCEFYATVSHNCEKKYNDFDLTIYLIVFGSLDDSIKKVYFNGNVCYNVSAHPMSISQIEGTFAGKINNNTCSAFPVFVNSYSIVTFNGEISNNLSVNNGASSVMQVNTGSTVILNGKITDNKGEKASNAVFIKNANLVIGENFEMDGNAYVDGTPTVDILINTIETEGYETSTITFEKQLDEDLEVSFMNWTTKEYEPEKAIINIGDGIDAEELLEKLKSVQGVEDFELDDDGNIICVAHVHETETISQVDATCTENGWTAYTVCSKCGLVLDGGGHEILATGHPTESYVANVNYKPATCTEDGYTGDLVCEICNEVITAGEVVSAVGHRYSELMNVVEATCYSEGYTGDVYCTMGLSQNEKKPLATTPLFFICYKNKRLRIFIRI